MTSLYICYGRIDQIFDGSGGPCVPSLSKKWREHESGRKRPYSLRFLAKRTFSEGSRAKNPIFVFPKPVTLGICISATFIHAAGITSPISLHSVCRIAILAALIRHQILHLREAAGPPPQGQGLQAGEPVNIQNAAVRVK